MLRIALIGASGPTGQLVAAQALTLGHHVVAATSHGRLPFAHQRLEVETVDVRIAADALAAVEGCDAVVVSSFDSQSAGEPVPSCSLETHNVLAAMQAHGVGRLVLVSSAGAGLRWRFSGRVALNRIMHPAMVSAWQRSALVDLRRTEALVQGCDRLWTIVRGAALFNLDHLTKYTVVDHGRPGWFTARSDLAAECVTQLDSGRNVRGTIAVTTAESTTAVLQALYNASRARSARRSACPPTPAVDVTHLRQRPLLDVVRTERH